MSDNGERIFRKAERWEEAPETQSAPGEDEPMHDVQRLIGAECDAVKAMLLEKNRLYGNSALAPMRVFSRASSIEQILVRIDDKLSRIVRGHAGGEDVEADLIGYLVLLRVARRLR